MSKLSKSVAKAYELIQSRLSIGYEIDGPRRETAYVIVLTSRVAGEGVTTVATELAQSYADLHQRRILLVDSTVKPGPLANRMGAECQVVTSDDIGEPSGDGELPDGVIRVGKTIELPVISLDGCHALCSPGWPTMLARLKESYDLIVVDAGCLETEAPGVWKQWADRIILVIDCTKMTIIELERLDAELRDSSIKLDGVILNKKHNYVPGFIYRRLG